jgi:hypothetical protein
MWEKKRGQFGARRAQFVRGKIDPMTGGGMRKEAERIEEQMLVDSKEHCGNC